MTNTNVKLSVIIKMTLLKFLNTTLIPILGNTSKSEWFENHGLMEEITFIVIFMNVGEAFRIMFHWEFVTKTFLRFWYKRQGEK